jgi:hypothetical protein
MPTYAGIFVGQTVEKFHLTVAPKVSDFSLKLALLIKAFLLHNRFTYT